MKICKKYKEYGIFLLMNYKIENDMNFFIELKKELGDILPIESDVSHNNNICLITHQPLEVNHVTLTCRHKFNYLPLYNEVVIQKKNYNYLEITRLALYQIKCPYCRTITNKLLPYIEHPDVSYIRGVNYPLRYCMTLCTCKWIIRSGKNKNNICERQAYETELVYIVIHTKNYVNKNRKMKQKNSPRLYGVKNTNN